MFAATAEGAGKTMPKDLKILHCRNGYTLQIHCDGTVNGTRERTLFTALQIIPEAVGLVRLQGFVSQRYLCMNGNSRLYAVSKNTTRGKLKECIFTERIEENNYNTYSSYHYKNLRWYVALNKRGKPLKGSKTSIKMQTSHFFVLDVAAPQLELLTRTYRMKTGRNGCLQRRKHKKQRKKPRKTSS